MSQDVCPWNARLAKDLPEDSPYAPREVLAGENARTLAREMLGRTQTEFSAGFRGSPMKRAKLRGLKRNAAVVLGNTGTMDDVPALEQALGDPEPLVRAHAAWALGAIRGRGRGGPATARSPARTDVSAAPGGEARVRTTGIGRMPARVGVRVR
jgi:epoxyqueuosine reductase